MSDKPQNGRNAGWQYGLQKELRQRQRWDELVAQNSGAAACRKPSPPKVTRLPRVETRRMAPLQARPRTQPADDRSRTRVRMRPLPAIRSSFSPVQGATLNSTTELPSRPSTAGSTRAAAEVRQCEPGSMWARPLVRAFVMGASDSNSILWLLGGHSYILEQISKAALQRCERHRQVLHGHTWKVTSVAELSNGLLVSGSGDTTVRIWDMNDDKPVCKLQGHTAGVTCIIQLKDGRIASGSQDYTLRIWDLRTELSVVLMEGHTHEVLCVVQLDGGRLLSGSRDKSLRVWSVEGKCERLMEGHSRQVNDVVQLRNGQVASASNDRSVRVWDVLTGCCTKELLCHTHYVVGVRQLWDEGLVTWSNDQTVRAWSEESEEWKSHVVIKHTDAISSLAQLSDGSLVTSSRDKTLCVWSKGLGQRMLMLHGHTAAVNAVIELSNGSILSCSDDKTLRIWC